MNAVAALADAPLGNRIKSRTLTLVALVALGMSPVRTEAQNDARLPANERDAFLSAVAEVETGGNARAIGRRGERGLYQFTRATWQRHSSRPFVEAHNPQVAYQVAVLHYDWLCERLKAAGRNPTNYQLAVAWNAGLGKALAGAAPRSTRDYARRVTNLAGMWRPPVDTRRQAPETMVASNPPAPASPPAARPMAVTLASAETAPVQFTLGRRETFTLGDMALQSDAIAAADEVTFTLAPAVVPVDETPAETAPSRRFIFATIGE